MQSSLKLKVRNLCAQRFDKLIKVHCTVFGAIRTNISGLEAILDNQSLFLKVFELIDLLLKF